jgi:T5SS/PEP-CTERM-associated repeat protein/autotransporter-associated beta strand protein
VTVSGAGATWTNSTALAIGDSGTGQLTIAGGGQVLTGASGGFLANRPGSTGTVTVTDPGSAWNINGGQLVVGGFLGPSSGTLIVQNGGTVSNTEGSIGYASGSTGTATVSGAGATWTNSGDLYIGRNGTGTLNIASGGTVSNVVGRVGGCEACGTSGVGTVTVSGAGTTWTNSAGLAIGASGTGQVTIAGGGQVLTGPSGGFLGVLAGATGTMTVTDPGSTWNISDQLTVGGAGSGMLIVQNGGTVTNAAGTIGSSSGSIGAVSVTGTGSTWTSSGNVTVGLAGTGALTVAGGGAVNVGGGTGTVVVANQVGSIGNLNIGAAPGSTAVAPGTLNAAAVQFGAGTGALNFNHTASGYVFAPTISGPGAVNVFAGTTIFTANNAYTGGTTINGGTLSISSDASLGAPSGGLAFGGGALQTTATFTTARPVSLNAGGGTFIPNAGTTLTLAGAVGGAGGLTMAGGGTLVLAGASSYSGGTTVNAGALQLGLGASLFAGGALTVNGGIFNLNGNTQTVGTLSGTGGTIALGAGTLTTNSSANTTLATQITGTGGFGKQGLGTLNLTGNNTYTGGTAVLAGTLAVNGSVSGNVAVGPAGTLGGNGTIGGNVVNAGTLAPGNSIGLLTVNGSYVQMAGSTYQVEANAAGQADRINVGGAASIQGGTVQVLAQPGNYGRSTTYTILNATGGVAGSYSGVTSNFAFLTPSLSYDANDVFLTLVLNSFSFGGQTFNQKAVGRVLDQTSPTASGDFATVLNAIAGLSTTQGPQILDAVSGQNYAGFSNAMVQGAQLFMSNFANRAGSASGGGARVALAEACDVACDTTTAALWGAWGGAAGGTGTIAGNSNAGTFTYSVGGFSGGLDRKITDNFLAGVTVGYLTGGQWTGGFQGRSVTDTVQAGLYGSFMQGPVYVDALAAYAYNANQLWRPINIPGLQPRTAYGQAGANQFLGQLEAGYRIDLGGTPGYFVTPFALLQGSVATQNGLTETGAQSLNLSVAQQTTSSIRTIFGAQVGAAMDIGLRDKIAAQLRLGWSHEYSDTARPVTASFVGAPAVPFTVFGAAPTRDGAAIGFSLSTAVAEAMSLYVRYEGNIAGRDSSHALTAGLRMSW